jgi:hypothetical protein
MSTKTYRGSCHCGRVQYEADVDLSKGTGKCNCSFCAKVRGWTAIVRPSAFRLLKGAKELSDYQFSETSVIHHRFCRSCGVRTFNNGNIPEIGGEYVAIQLSTLDDLPPSELLSAPLRYFDGRNDNWFEEPAETRHL